MRIGWIALLCACGDGSGKSGTDSTDTGPETLPPSATLALTDETNFAYQATCTLPVSQLAPGADFTVDWSSLTHDLFGRPFDPLAVWDVILSARSDTVEQILSGLAAESLDEAALIQGWHAPPNPGGTLAASEMLFDSHPLVPSDAVVVDRTFFAALVDADLGVISGGLATVGGSDSRLTIDDSARLDWSAALSNVALSTTPDLGPWTIDWSMLAHDARGVEVDPLALEQVFLARLDATTDAEVSAALLELEASAAEWYVKYVAGLTSVDASELSTTDGEDDFAGFTTDGTWVVGLRCSACGSAVPRFLALVRVLPGGSESARGR